MIRSSSIRQYVLVSDPAMGHLDPLLDYPDRNRFLRTVVPFLRTVVGEPSPYATRSRLAVRSSGGLGGAAAVQVPAPRE